ncbi:Hypothetical protein SRAE_X000232500 [Strongyloides ratti]|uniref:Zinc finger, CCHC-type domain-containing protein n=1 Tax=Strongyloides ratti TaxID=34506 RepID=A0A090KSW4_STRRB|nr:Hypothetical protein SRAE_X000232500 [Strongyloides ratti]CEF60590.1 Hypothetical protein SRAE_X000232500 [Strongyloides ratti]
MERERSILEASKPNEPEPIITTTSTTTRSTTRSISPVYTPQQEWNKDKIQLKDEYPEVGCTSQNIQLAARIEILPSFPENDGFTTNDINLLHLRRVESEAKYTDLEQEDPTQPFSEGDLFIRQELYSYYYKGLRSDVAERILALPPRKQCLKAVAVQAKQAESIARLRRIEEERPWGRRSQVAALMADNGKDDSKNMTRCYNCDKPGH